MSTTVHGPPTRRREPSSIRVTCDASDIVSLYLRGEFDASNAPEITEHAHRALAAGKHLVLDLSDTTFIDASVIGALCAINTAAAERGRSAVLQLGTAPIVERVISVTEVERVLPRTSTRVDAIARIRALAG
jgi:anti-anti-sigma factor